MKVSEHPKKKTPRLRGLADCCPDILDLLTILAAVQRVLVRLGASCAESMCSRVRPYLIDQQWRKS